MKKTLLCLATVLFCVFSVSAACTGTDNIQDGEYYSTDHCKEWTNGYSWSFEMTQSGVLISVTAEDDLAGLAAAYLFDRTDNGFSEVAMTLNGKTATTTLTGYAEGKAVAFLVKFLVEGGDIFTKRFAYTVGDNCEGGAATDVPTCSGFSTANDPVYTAGDAAASEWENGYNWVAKTTDNGVEVSVEFREQWVGMTAPYIFIFNEDGTLYGGSDHAMNYVGNTATYTIEGFAEGDKVEFMVKIAYALHVAFTERITYIVGQDCNEGGDDEGGEGGDDEGGDDEGGDGEGGDDEGGEEQSAQAESININAAKAHKFIGSDGQIYLLREGRLFNLLGAEVK